MADSRYKYLFPYEKVPYNSNILIYGAGIMGMEYLKQLNITGYCRVVGMIDKNAKEYNQSNVNIYEPSIISNLQFDYVVIAVRAGGSAKDIRSFLLEQGVEENKIVYVLEREEVETVVPQSSVSECNNGYAYDLTDGAVGILLCGGLGDMVIIKRFIQEIIRLLPDCKMDLYYSNCGDFIKFLFSDCVNVNRVIADLGYNYNANKSLYTIALDIVSTRYVHVDNLLKEKLICLDKQAYEVIERLRCVTDEEQTDFNTLPYLLYSRRMCRGENAYTAFGYNGVFDITDKNVSIPLLKSAEEQFRVIGLGNYITINYGVGIVDDAEKHAKSWPYEYMCEFVKQFKAKYGDIQVVQIGGANVRKMQGADQYLLGLDYSVVVHILNNSIFHLDIEGGLVHIASQLGTKCFVLFGQTPASYFEYESNTNIHIGECQGCYGMYKDPTICARGMDKPECMYSITPKIVMVEVDEYMYKRYN